VGRARAELDSELPPSCAAAAVRGVLAAPTSFCCRLISSSSRTVMYLMTGSDTFSRRSSSLIKSPASPAQGHVHVEALALLGHAVSHLARAHLVDFFHFAAALGDHVFECRE
jgi:hypothetical protein